jgi:acetyl esterase/lipase
MIILATILSGISLLMSVLLLVRLKEPSPVMFAKLFAGALSPYWAIAGAAGAAIGWVYRAIWVVPFGVVGAGMMIWYLWRCTQEHKGLERAFGADWSEQINPEQTSRMVKRRWSPYINMKVSPEPIWERDVPFWTIPGNEGELLCDVWRPSNGDVSGLALIYFHGGGWAAGEKDMFTRPLFHHLTSQGHTVMDVAYRLIPEVDIYGMIGDIKHAIAWMKVNASRYGVDPEKIVLGGSSVGSHLALLAGYTPGHPELTPDELKSVDLSVSGIISYYGPSDLLASYEQWMKQAESSNRPEEYRYAGRLDILLGGNPQDIPEAYQLANPANHVGPDSPPTLLMQGDKDLLVPVETTRALYAKLVESGVPAIKIIFPWTEHMFDLILPQISPPAQSALYDVDRFLALLANKD